MRKLFLILFSLSSSYAAELIYISNDTMSKNLEILSTKYKQALLINDNHVYLIPKECQLTRYFGGAGQAPVKLIERPAQTQEIVITQVVFEAKDKVAIQEEVEIVKSIALIEGKVSKAFLDDQEGRGFGGASEVPLDFTFQKMAAKKIYMKPERKTQAVTEDIKPYQHPSCQLLNDGSGYALEGTQGAQLYEDHTATPILKQSILFN